MTIRRLHPRRHADFDRRSHRRRRQVAVLWAVVMGALAAAMSGCATPALIPAAPSPLADPCLVVTRADISAAFIRGVPGPATSLYGDESSRACSLLVHDVNGDEHLVVTIARNGGAAFASVCDTRTHTNASPLRGIGTGACWNPDDISVSAVCRGTFYSAAIIDPVTPQDFDQSLVHLMQAVCNRAR